MTTAPPPDPHLSPTGPPSGRDTTDVASEQASQVAGTASDEASRLAGDAGDRARDVADDARRHVQGIADVAASQVRDRADDELTRAGGGLRQASDQARALADGRTDEAGPFGDYAASAATALGDWADRLEQGSVTDLLGDVSDFARRKPGQFLAGAFVAGLVAGRVGRNVRASDVEVPDASTSSAADRPSTTNGRGSTSSADHGNPEPVGEGRDLRDHGQASGLEDSELFDDGLDDVGAQEPEWVRDRDARPDDRRATEPDLDAPTPPRSGTVVDPGSRA